jgi:hypothetical protein
MTISPQRKAPISIPIKYLDLSNVFNTQQVWIVAVYRFCMWESPRVFVAFSGFMLSTYTLASGHCQFLAAELRKTKYKFRIYCTSFSMNIQPTNLW